MDSDILMAPPDLLHTTDFETTEPPHVYSIRSAPFASATEMDGSPQAYARARSFIEEGEKTITQLDKMISSWFHSFPEMKGPALSFKEAIARAVIQHKHWVSGCSRLTDDTLVLIFEQLKADPKHPEEAPWSVSSVCQYWRGVALAYPALWRTFSLILDIADFNPTAARRLCRRLNLQLARSSPCTLDVVFDIFHGDNTQPAGYSLSCLEELDDDDDDYTNGVYAVVQAGPTRNLMQNSQRFRKLALSGEVPPGFPPITGDLGALRILDVTCNDWIDQFRLSRVTTPRLEQLMLRYVCLDDRIPTDFDRNRIQHLELEGCAGLPSQLVDILRKMQATLQSAEINIDTDCIDEDDVEEDDPVSGLIAFPRLRNMALHCTSPFYEPVLLHIHAPNLVSLEISWVEDYEDVAHDIQHLLRHSSQLKRMAVSNLDTSDSLVPLLPELGALTELHLTFRISAHSTVDADLDPLLRSLTWGAAGSASQRCPRLSSFESMYPHKFSPNLLQNMIRSRMAGGNTQNKPTYFLGRLLLHDQRSMVWNQAPDDLHWLEDLKDQGLDVVYSHGWSSRVLTEI